MYYLDTCTCIDLMRGKLPHGYELMKSSKEFVRIPSLTNES